MIKIVFLLVTFGTVLQIYVNGHGMVVNPVSRSSRWRVDRTAPTNYNDNQLFCGGFYTQRTNGGRCGVCGDNFKDSVPRANELGGRYGQGVIVGEYKSGGQLPVDVRITASHMGYFTFNLCNLDNSGETDACFNAIPLKLVNGQTRYPITSRTGLYTATLQLPAGLRCAHCVLQWTYVAGNNWGICPNGSGALGCGPQENFRTCSDIRIV